MRVFKYLVFLFLFGCSAIDTSNIAPGYVEAFKNIRYIFEDKNNPAITKDVVSEIPYASSIMTIGRSMPALIILAEINDFQETWISADDVYVVTSKGKITKTSGLINNLTRSVLPDLSFHELIEGNVYQYTYYLSYDEPPLNDLQLESRIVRKGKEKVTILETTRTLTLIEETIKNNYLGWSVKNKYWIDDTGFVWKSVQSISPKLPQFELEVTKKPAL